MFKSSNNSNKIKAKQDDNDTEDHETIPARLQRGFSKTGNNIELVGRARDFMQKEISLNDEEEFFAEKTEFTFTLPDLMKYNEGFKAFLFKELVESSMLVSLEQEGHLNWWTDIGICDRLLPMVTCGDGNCLLHSASLSMWGFHDRVLALRRALHTVMLRSQHLEAFRRRWRHQQSVFLKTCGLVLDELEWIKEWDLLVEVTSLEPRNAAQTDQKYAVKTQLRGGSQMPSLSNIPFDAIYESLEEFHVFILCHIIKRPIIVIASPFLKNSQGENFSPVPFRGIYLPLERPPDVCCTSPLLLAYNLGHFCALAAMQSNSSTNNCTLTIPLVDCEMNLLPIHFLIDPILHPGQDVPSNDYKLSMLKKYLDVKMVGATNLGGAPEKDEAPLIDLGDNVRSNLLARSGNKDELNRPQRRRSSLQSTKYFHPFASSQDAPNLDVRNVICARLSIKKTPFANELVKNYLREAELKYDGITQQKVIQLEEIRRVGKDGIQLRPVNNPSSSPGKFFNIFRSNVGRAENAGSSNKLFASGTLPSKTSAILHEANNSSKILRNLTPNSNHINASCRQSVPIGSFDKHQEVPAIPLGVVASGHDKKEFSGAVKTIQKLLGQNKIKSEKSTFYRTCQDSTVATGKSKFYTNFDEITSGSSQDVHTETSSLSPSASSSILAGHFPDEANFSTFPSRSSTANQKSRHFPNSPSGENTSSLPKIKSNMKGADKNWKKTLGFNASTSDPNIFDNQHYAGIGTAGNNVNMSSSETSDGVLPCRTDRCTFFGSREKRGFCSVCFAERGLEESCRSSDLKHSQDKTGRHPEGHRQDAQGTKTEYLVDQHGFPYCQTRL